MILRIDKELFQWEKNRYIYVDDLNISKVEFFNKKSKNGIEVLVENNKAKIPNHLLKEAIPIMALGCIEVEGEFQVVTRREFKVLQRAKPESYLDDDISKEIIYDGGMEV